MNDVRQKAKGFLEAIAESPGLWHSVDVRVIAISVAGIWHNLITRCRLEASRHDQVPQVRHLPRTPHLIALQEVHPITTLESLLEALQVGKLQVNGYLIRYLREVTATESEEPYTHGYLSRAHPLNLHSVGERAVAHELTPTGDRAGDLFRVVHREREGIDALLRGLAHPWNGLDALTLYATGYRRHVGGDHSRHVSVVAPLEASLLEPECVLRDRELRFSVVAATAEARRGTSLGLFGADRSGHIISSSLPLGERRWRKTPAGYRFDGRSPVRNAQSLTLMLRVGKQDVAQLTVKDRTGEPPLLLAAHQAALPRAKPFREILLDPPDSEAKLFERYVGRVLEYCGFQVDPFDPEKESKAVDVLAYAPDHGLLLTIECTVGAINPEGKLTRLIDRTAAIRTAMEKRAHPPVVLPVVVTPKRHEALGIGEQAEAESQRIRVLCREELEVLLDLAMTAAPLRQALEVIHPQPRSAWTTGTLNPLIR